MRIQGRLLNTCGGCANTWAGLAMCHCATCHQTFGGIRSFDRHRTGGVCHEPTSLGFYYNESRRCWSEPYSWARPNADQPAKAVLHAYGNDTTRTVTISSIYADPASSRTIYEPEPSHDQHIGVGVDEDGFYETQWHEPRSKDW